MAMQRTSGNQKLIESGEGGAALATVQPTELVPATPMSMIQAAVERGASIEQINQLLDLKDRIEAKDAEKAFVAAMSAFKACNVVVTKDMVNSQYTTAQKVARYTSLGNLVKTVTPFLSQNGLSAGWDIAQSATGVVTVTCTITHSQGHSKSVSMTAAPDGSGAKNPIQQIKSTITYLKACTFESACGLAATEEGNLDDDGNAAGPKPKPTMADEELVAACDNIGAAATREELKTIYAGNYKAAQKLNDKHAMNTILAAYEKRKAELQEEAA